MLIRGVYWLKFHELPHPDLNLLSRIFSITIIFINQSYVLAWPQILITYQHVTRRKNNNDSTSPLRMVAPTYKTPQVMAEIGCNHKGDMKIAKELLLLAKNSGCAYAKFQKRNPKELLTLEQYDAPHPNPMNSYGETYGAHREYLELSVEQHKELKEYCDSIELGYSCSVWDVTSAREIVSLEPDLIKVGSPSNLHWEMMRILRDQYSGDVHISTGMTTKGEVEEIVKFWEEGGNAKGRVVLYNCTSGYPVPFEDVCLLEL
jgi:N-acetylneuraminate synthase